MIESLSPNTKAVLMLTAPLIVGRSKEAADLVTAAEYKRLAQRLRELGRKPADLIGPSADQLLVDCATVIDNGRLERLLARGFLLSQAVERWQSRALWVLGRSDPDYPQRLRVRLKEDSPPLLYGCGEKTLLNRGGLAVVGSRNVSDSLIEYTKEIGRIAASVGRTVVSGGAGGIDQAAMRGALEASGRVIGVLADSLERTALHREHRNYLLEGCLVLISPYDPNAGFNVGHAMQRNKVIYALADAALVVNADVNKGGTWAGATEQLEKLHLVPIYVRSTGEAAPALDALRKKGAQPWPNPEDTEAMDAALAADFPDRLSVRETQTQLFLDAEPVEPASEIHTGIGVPSVSSVAPKKQPVKEPELQVADELFRSVRSLVVRIVREPKKAGDVAAALGVTLRQAEEWLKRLVDENVLEKSKKPVRYTIRQSSLFSIEGSGDREHTAVRSGK